VVRIVFLDQEVSWHILIVGQWNDLGQIVWLAPLAEVNFVSINDDVLSKILVGVEAGLVRWRWLVHGPVVEWWVPDWVLGVSLHQVVSVNSIDDHVSKLQVLISSVSVIVWWRWLVNRPVVEWWVPHWVLGIELNVRSFLLSKVELIWTYSHLRQTKASLSHCVLSHD